MRLCMPRFWRPCASADMKSMIAICTPNLLIRCSPVKTSYPYNDTSANRQPCASYVDRLLAANALVLMYPVWNEGFPAILKGFLDRVFLPGVSFRKDPDGGRKAGVA